MPFQAFHNLFECFHFPIDSTPYKEFSKITPSICHLIFFKPITLGEEALFSIQYSFQYFYFKHKRLRRNLCRNVLSEGLINHDGVDDHYWFRRDVGIREAL
jgi:hypothetical protein